MALLVVGMFGSFFLGALYLQRILGYSPLQVGLAFLPGTLVMAFCSLRLSHRFAPRTILAPALAITTAGLALYMRMPVDGTYVIDVLPSQILTGVGMGLVDARDDDAGDVRRDAAGRRPGQRPDQHHRAGRRRDRPGRAGHDRGRDAPAPRRPSPALLDGYHAAFDGRRGGHVSEPRCSRSRSRHRAVVLRVRDVLAPGRV